MLGCRGRSTEKGASNHDRKTLWACGIGQRPGAQHAALDVNAEHRLARNRICAAVRCRSGGQTSQLERHPYRTAGEGRIAAARGLRCAAEKDVICMKKIGFLSFGHWTPSPHSQTQSAADVLLQSIDLAVEAERLGMDGAYFRVHHFARQLASPFPLLAAIGARTRKIEIGTGVIDMRYENPHYMAEDAGAADLIAGSRLQLGISRGSPEQVISGWRHFGYRLADGEDDVGLGRRHAEEFLELLRGKGFAQANPRPMFANPPGLLRLELTPRD
jgi:hypothetical protein